MGLFTGLFGDPAAQQRLARLERQVEFIMQHLGIQEPQPDRPAEVQALARAGKKIEAIKLYRELTGVGLAEAKAAVDEMGR